MENNHFPADSHNDLGKLVFIIFHNKLGTFFRNSHEIVSKPVTNGCTVYIVHYMYNRNRVGMSFSSQAVLYTEQSPDSMVHMIECRFA